MKATELMIGDLVGIETPVVMTLEEDEEKDGMIPFKVVEFNNECVRIVKPWNNEAVDVPYDKVHPVPLTVWKLKEYGLEEVNLEGIAKANNPTGEWMYCFGQFDSVTYLPDSHILRIKFMEGLMTDFSDIRYVHELQHALRLVGIEKEIVL